jgi:hypothetical protein
MLIGDEVATSGSSSRRVMQSLVNPVQSEMVPYNKPTFRNLLVFK